MDILKLRAKDGIDPEIGAHFRFISSVRNTYSKHTHDFFELFLILKGNVTHCINGTKQLLEENSLVFVRENDVHYYEQTIESDCQFINLSFYKNVIDSLFEYLGEGLSKDTLLLPEMPPVVILTKHEKHYIQNRLESLNLIPNSKKILIKAKVRALLVELFSRYFMESSIVFSNNHPAWLNRLCSIMKEKDNFVQGMPALLGISGKTHSHLCRVFKQYLGITPIEYINSLRLSYAENLLLNTDMDIIEICPEVGFENMSYFYELFKNHFNTTPHKYRKENNKNLFYPWVIG